MSNPFGSGSEDSNVIRTSGTHSNRAPIHEKPLSDFISKVPDELCVPTADFNPFQFWNVDSEEIETWGEQINDAIQTAVNRHHRGFNQATTEFDEILSAFHDSEMKFKRLTSNLLEAKKLLSQSRGQNGKTASIAKQWKAFESYKKKLKELDKIEYILEIPQIFDKYLSKKQFIHAAVLLNDGLTLSYTHKASLEAGKQLQSSGNIILNKKNDLEKLLRQQLYQQIYFKTNSLRVNLLRPPKRNPNKNILNLLNFQKEIMMMDEEDEKKPHIAPNHTLAKSNSLIRGTPHFKMKESVHYDTLASLNQEAPSSMGGDSNKKKHKNVLTSTSQPTSLQDPHKIIVPTYKSFRNLDDVKDGSADHKSIIGNAQHLLVAETTDEYLKLASNNNNYSDDEQPLFLTICVTAVDQIGRAVPLKTNLFKSLDVELKEIIEREIYEVCNAYQQNMIQSNQMTNMIEPEEQSLMLLSATQNVFKIFMRVLANHKTVIHVFKQTGRSSMAPQAMDRLMRLQTYTMASVWNGVQKAVLHGLLYKYLDKHLLERTNKPQSQSHSEKKEDRDSAVDFLLLGDLPETQDHNILKVRSASPSPSPSISRQSDNNPKSFGARLKDSKFFKRRKSSGVPPSSTDESKEHNDATEDDGARDLFAKNTISGKYHQLAMDGLTFSFADSNIGSIVLDSEYGGTGVTSHHHKTMPSEFAAPGLHTKRLSIGSANAFTAAAQGQPARRRGATQLNAFSSRQRSLARQHSTSHALTIAAAMGKTDKNSNDKTGKSKNKGGKGKDNKRGIGASSRSVAGRRRKELALIEASPYHVTKLYKPIIHFVESAEWKVLGLADDDNAPTIAPILDNRNNKTAPDTEYDLRHFLQEFVKDRFIPNMQAEAYYQMGQVLLDNQPMDQIRIADEPLLLLKSSYGIFDLIKTLFEYYVVLPGFDSAQFVDMIQVILSKVRDTYQQAMDEICEILISRELIFPNHKSKNNNNNYVDRLSAYNLRKLFESSMGDIADDPYKDKYDRRAYEKIDTEVKTVDAYSYAVIAEKHQHINSMDLGLFLKMIHQDDAASFNFNFNTEYYSKLALISTGLFWLSNKVTSELITPLMAKEEQKRRATRVSGGNFKSKSKHSSLSAICDFLSSTFEPRSEKCVSIIRMEMRSQVVCLLKNISCNNYWMPEDSIINKPQDFIITLNKLLVSCEAKLNGCVQPRLITYLFEELAYFICDIIIYQIPLVKSGKINHVGYKQLYKNTFSLQQNLTTITQKGMEKCFDRAQKYLKLSQKTPQDIKKIHDIKNKKYGTDKEKYAAYNFTKDQYDAISTVAKLSNAHRK